MKENKGNKRELPAGREKRKREETPPSSLSDGREAEFQRQEERAILRRMEEDSSWEGSKESEGRAVRRTVGRAIGRGVERVGRVVRGAVDMTAQVTQPRRSGRLGERRR